MVRQIYPEQHAIGEPICFYSFTDLNKYLDRSLGYANRLIYRSNQPIITTPNAKKVFIVERVGKKLIENFNEALEAYFGQKVGYFGTIKTLTRKETLAQKQLSKELAQEKKERRREIRILLFKLDTEYGDLTKVPTRDNNFKKLQSLLGGDDLDESVDC